MARFGELQGFVMGSEGMVSPWQQGYIVTALAEIAGMNLPGTSDNAVKMLDYMTNFVAGLYTNGDNGYDRENGTAYWLFYEDPDTGTPYSTWSEFTAKNVELYPIYGYGLAAADRDSIAKTNLTEMSHGYGVIAKAALADLITYTKSPKAIEAYGYIVGQIAAAWDGNIAGMAEEYQYSTMWNVKPRLPNGDYLSANQMQIDVSKSSTVTLTAGNGNSLLAVVGGGTATLTGGSGVDLLFGGSGPTTLIGGAGDDFLFAGSGATIFIDGAGDDYMKGGSAADTFTFADINPGHDTIANFKADTDVLKVKSNLNGNGITSAEQLISGATVVEGSTVLHLSATHDVTMRGIGTPSTLANSITMI